MMISSAVTRVTTPDRREMTTAPESRAGQGVGASVSSAPLDAATWRSVCRTVWEWRPELWRLGRRLASRGGGETGERRCTGRPPGEQGGCGCTGEIARERFAGPATVRAAIADALQGLLRTVGQVAVWRISTSGVKRELQ